jgi:hypothetical protein
MHTEQNTPQLYRISRGQPLALHLDVGSELFCRQGALQLDIASLGLAELHGTQHTMLHTGQSWRAAQSSHVQLHAAGAQGVQIMLHRPQIQQSRPAPVTEAGRLDGHLAPGLGAMLAGLWNSLRRGRRAA